MKTGTQICIKADHNLQGPLFGQLINSHMMKVGNFDKGFKYLRKIYKIFEKYFNKKLLNWHEKTKLTTRICILRFTIYFFTPHWYASNEPMNIKWIIYLNGMALQDNAPYYADYYPHEHIFQFIQQIGW